MKVWQKDKAMSDNILSQFKSKLAPQQCYANVFRVVIGCMNRFVSGEWRVAYGFVSSCENVYVRHAFILDQNGTVIDPTPFRTEKASDKYFTFKVFETISEYLDATSHEDGYPALSRYLRNEEHKLQLWGYENGYLFIG